MNAAPLVSVVVPYLRAGATIARALDSVLGQTLVALEVVAVGDGSTDGSDAIVRTHARRDARIRMLSFPDNHGPSFARNRGIEAARGTWIAVLDADDRFDADRLRSMVDAAGSAAVVVDNLVGVDPLDGSPTGPLFPTLPAALSVEDIVAHTAPHSTYNFGYLKPLFRRAFLADHALRYDEGLRTAEDLLLLTECAIVGGPIPAIDRGGYFYNLQFSPRTRQVSRTSHSLPVDRQVAAAFDDLLARRADALTPSQRGAIEGRRDRLRRDADVSNFRHAMKTGHYLQAASLLATSARVRGYLSRTVANRVTGGARGA